MIWAERMYPNMKKGRNNVIVDEDRFLSESITFIFKMRNGILIDSSEVGLSPGWDVLRHTLTCNAAIPIKQMILCSHSLTLNVPPAIVFFQPGYILPIIVLILSHCTEYSRGSPLECPRESTGTPLCPHRRYRRLITGLLPCSLFRYFERLSSR